MWDQGNQGGNTRGLSDDWGGESSFQSARKIGHGTHAEGRRFEKEQVLMCHLRRGPNLPSVFQEIKAALCKNTETDGSH